MDRTSGAGRVSQVMSPLQRILPIVVIAALLLSGCGIGFFDRGRSVLKNAREMGWRTLHLRGGNFTLLGVANPTRSGSTLYVYIESDGLAWLDRGTPSPDPTPNDPISLRLALRDRGAPVLYLARPCQFIGPSLTNRCRMRHWTSHRFSSEVITGYTEIISAYAQRIGAGQVVMIGFSGGGVVAALVAARLPETAGLISVAAPLDVRAWTRLHRVTPLRGSLNPRDDSQVLEKLSQIHFVGQKDRIVPASVVRSFANQMPQAEVIVVPSQRHSCCWPEVWPELLAKARHRLAANRP